MTIALIAPRRNNRSARKKKFGTGFFRVPPLGVLNVAAATPKDIDVRLVDENVEELSYADAPDLVGISVMTASADRAYEIADRYRELGVPVVLGGSHVSAMAEEALEHADSVVIGEAEGAWDVLLADFRKGGRAALQRSLQGSPSVPDLSALPYPDLEYGPAQRPLRHHQPLQHHPGMPSQLLLLLGDQAAGRKIRYRPVDSVVREIAAPWQSSNARASGTASTSSWTTTSWPTKPTPSGSSGRSSPTASSG